MDKNKKIWIILTDDWELKGNGLGSVKDMQYKPANLLMDIYEKLGVPAVFNVEVMQQLSFEKYASEYSNINDEKDFWNKSVSSMIERGHDVQLHIHPQWHNAKYDGQYWKLDNRWNLGDYSDKEISQFIEQSIEYLKASIPNWSPKAFRSGSWGVIPKSDVIFKALLKNNINLDVSICQGIYYNGDAIKLDYTNVESPYIPYYPDLDNPLNISTINTRFFEIPTQSIILSDFNLLQKIMKKMYSKINKKTILQKQYDYPSHILTNPFGFESGNAKEDFIIDFSNSHDFYSFKIAIDILMKRAIKTINDSEQEFDFLPLIFENHTKNLDEEKFKKIEKIILYIQRNFSDIAEFKTLSDVSNNIEKMYVNRK